ncbi:hypothetical protein CGLAR1_14240 [Corynebacterium glutamicum]|nr:hypothetical protein CGLAR1_14240 [Corynebacterium glutamicum]AIK89129.1 hypothetical protein AR0_14380 [Corynebacterium glutamicum]
MTTLLKEEHMRTSKPLVILGVVTLLALAGCSEGETNPRETPVLSAATSTTVQPSLPAAGDVVEAPGVTLTVVGVSESDHLMLHADGFKPGYRPEERLDAPEGGRFTTVTTTVNNTGLVSWDLTCGFALQAHVFSDKDQRFDPIDDLDRIPGNPECNDSINPGFDATMIWSFAVADGVEITHFGFADPETHYNDLVMVDITDAQPAPTTTPTAPMNGPAAPPAVVEQQPSTRSMTTTEEAPVVPPRPPFMDPEDYDPFGPLRFVECWESNAAVMSDGSIVTDTVNCAPDPVESFPYDDSPPRADGCVGPAAVCGYYDDAGNPIWVDKTTGETSPRYYDEFGNPTMVAP